MPKNGALMPTQTNNTTKGNNDVAISPALPARWGYLAMDTDCHQPTRPRDREACKRLDRQLHNQFVACLVALPVVTMVLVAVCVAAVMSADRPEDHYGPEERMHWERSQ